VPVAPANPGPKHHHTAGPDTRKANVRGSLNYRSDLKRAILVQLTKRRSATDLEICRGLDADGAVELPSKSRESLRSRSFEAAYKDSKLRHPLESAISKVRKDVQDNGLDSL
jgi:hypothetical protein